MDIVQNQSNSKKKKENSQVFYQTICMQVIKFLVSYVNNKILKQIIEGGDFVEIIYPHHQINQTKTIKSKF